MSYPMSVRAGDSFRRVVTWSEDDGVTPIVLTGCSVEWSLYNGSTRITFEDDESASITDGAGGEITLFLSDSDTRSLRNAGLSVFRYELSITFTNGDRETILYGFFSVDWEVAP
jgi:hypothetical protein